MIARENIIWNNQKESLLQVLKDKWQHPLENAVNWMGGAFNEQKTIVNGGANDKSFDDFGLAHYTLYYRRPEKFWNEVGLLVSNSLTSEDLKTPRPVHVHFMGGGFWTGDWKFCPWYLQAALRQANTEKAIILAVNYPRFPLADGNDISRAVADFWDYFHSDCDTELTGKVPTLRIDKNKLVISGESAGGWLAALSVLKPHNDLNARALFLRYPMLRYYERLDRDSEKLIYMGKSINKSEVSPRAKLLLKIVEEVRDEMKLHGLLGKSSEGVFADLLERREPPYGMCGAFTSSWTGTWINYIGGGVDDVLTQMEKLTARPRNCPTLLIYRGDVDSQVAPKISDDFVKCWKRLYGDDAKIHDKLVRGESHGFDYVLQDEDALMEEFMGALKQAWL